jgi:DNA-binding MarR family transcriptional regulator
VATRAETRETAACACSGVRRAGRALTHRYDEALAPSGLRVTQYAVLSRLDRIGPVAVGRLAEEMALDRTALTRSLAPLRRDGLVADAAGGDRRSRPVVLTPAGAEALAAARPLWRQAQASLAEGFGPERLAALLAELAAVEAAAAAIAPGATARSGSDAAATGEDPGSATGTSGGTAAGARRGRDGDAGQGRRENAVG